MNEIFLIVAILTMMGILGLKKNYDKWKSRKKETECILL